jgi:hypothetical protein
MIVKSCECLKRSNLAVVPLVIHPCRVPDWRGS